MPARSPRNAIVFCSRRSLAGDLETAVALYEPNASFVQDSGEVTVGRAAIREVMKGLHRDQTEIHREVALSP